MVRNQPALEVRELEFTADEYRQMAELVEHHD